MAIALDRPTPAAAPEPDVPSPSSPWWAVAVIASIGAGAIHAAAAGAHAEHPQAVRAFTAVAAVQIGWAVWATRSSRSAVRWIGAVLALGAVAGWITAKTVGIGFVQGLQTPEPVQTADAVAAALAVTAVVMIGLASLPRLRSMHDQSRPPALVASAAVAALALIAVNGIDSHDHGSHVTAAAGHSHAAPATVSPHPYDPTKPIDLGGVPGVTPRQQAAAENLVVITLARLPHWADANVAEAAGFRSIGDGFTGVEHFVNQTFMNDDVILDPDRPESLVYDTTSGGRRLVAAMYMEKPGTPLGAVPNIGGALMQWHIHDNLCYNAAGRVAGLTDAAGNCPAGLLKPTPTPMIHVWIEPHKCGPFAALEGIGGGRVKDGEPVLCDHVHGA